MTPSDRIDCQHLDEYLDGLLDREKTAAFLVHLDECPECLNLVNKLTELREAMAEEFCVDLQDDRDLRIRKAVSELRNRREQSRDVMDIEQLAEFLGVSTGTVVGMLDQLPTFEINGHLRFRREKIVEWIEDEEAKMQWERDVSMMRRSERNVLLYRKPTDDDTDKKRRIV